MDGARAASSPKGRVLVVDDEEPLCRAFQRLLEHAGYEVAIAADGAAAIARLGEPFDAVVSDVRMPEMDGLALLRAVRQRDLDLPVVLMTGAPDIDGAIEAIDYGAYKYIPKPVQPDALRDCVRRAVALRRMATLKRQCLALLGESTARAADRAGLEASFARALSSLWIAFQPIVLTGKKRIFGFEALLRSDEPSLPRPDTVIDAAERLGRLEELGRAVRAAAASAMTAAGDAALFVNLHPRDLADEELFDPGSPLARIAERVVLEITERASVDAVSDLRDRITRLRRLGFRIAIDDLGAGYAGLTSFATLEPEIVKLDMTLVRGLDSNAVKRRVVAKITSLSHEMNILLVAEGVETAAERDALEAIDCDLLQGYLFARPGRPFPSVAYP
jgi:EAL domain-containing protein (putative c-di-GMP-specific phosphodiesterase class I)